MSLPLTARIYLAAMVFAAVAMLGYWLIVWRGPISDNYVLIVVLTLLAMVAMHFPLAISPRHKVEVSMAVYFASLLLFGAPVGLVIVGTSQLAGGLVLRLRPHPVQGRQTRSIRSIIFNTSQLMLALGLGAQIYYSFLPQTVPASLGRWENLLAIPVAAALIYFVNSMAVAVMVGLQLKQSPAEVWLAGWRVDALQIAGLFLIGMVTALSSLQNPWVPLIMALPTALVYLSLKRTVELLEQTVAAVESMADVVDMRDRYTFEHSKRVAEYAGLIARRMRLSSDEVKSICLSARVHDLGKVGIPDTILLKPGKLTPEEWEIMRKHPQIGYDILSRFPQYRQGRELVLMHHERFDGSGYPGEVDGHQLPLGAQIIAVADALEAMTADRPYRRALSLDQAMAEFRRCKGSQWHPSVIDALEGMVAQQGQGAFRRLSAVASA